MKIKLIYTTTDSNKIADKIAEILIQDNQSPCVQIIPNIQSTYKWKDKLEKYLKNKQSTRKRTRFSDNLFIGYSGHPSLNRKFPSSASRQKGLLLNKLNKDSHIIS